MKTNRCQSCETRPAMTASHPEYSHGVKLCEPCYTQAGWENAHSDHGHDDIETYSLANTHFTQQTQVDAYKAETRREMKDCWVCHPELDRAAEAYVPRRGVDRTGQKQYVPIHASGTEKAKTVAERIAAWGWACKIRTAKSVTTLRINSINLLLVWDAAGRFDYRSSAFGDRKVRNVAEALRLVAETGK